MATVIAEKDRKKLMKQVLKQMRVRLKAGWTQNATARTNDNSDVDYNSRHAVKFCLTGARDRAFLDLKIPPKKRPVLQDWLNKAIAEQVYPDYEYDAADAVIEYNDANNRTQKQVLKTLDVVLKSI